MDELIALLTDQRQLLDDLLYRLVAARGVLAAGEIRYVARASSEIETVVTEIYAAETRRAAGIAIFAERLGCPPQQITLRSLANAAPEPYRTLLEHLHTEFLRLTDEIERNIAMNKSLAAKGAAELTRMLTALGAPTPADRPLTYGPNGLRRGPDSSGNAGGIGATPTQRPLAELRPGQPVYDNRGGKRS
ncbi:MAG: flagellar export chaperone FlgN [Acidimicrobiales bacterium]